jgi:hypothetical protein
MMVGEGGGICMHGLEASESALCTIHEWGLDFGSLDSRQRELQGRIAAGGELQRKAKGCRTVQLNSRITVSNGSKEELNLEGIWERAREET